MKVLIAGGSGFVGEALVRQFLTDGHVVSVLTRNPAKVKHGKPLLWDGRTRGDWWVDAAESDVIVNLAGENIGEGRWTEERKRALLQSRVDATRALVGAVRSAPPRKRTFISASAVGFYGPRGDEILDETATKGEGFLSDMAATLP